MKPHTIHPHPAYVYPDDLTCACGSLSEGARCPCHPCPGTFHFTQMEAIQGALQRQVHNGRPYRAMACPHLAGAWHVEPGE